MIQEIQRMKAMGLGKKTVARALSISKNTVKLYWDIPIDSDGDDSNSDRKKPLKITQLNPAAYEAPWSKQVDWVAVKKSVDSGEALSVWLEEQQEICINGIRLLEGVRYTSFWREFKRRYPEVPLEFHKNHPPGERTEIDHKGERSGFGYYQGDQFILCEMFGAVLCFSQLLYIEATPSQKKAEFLASIHRGFTFFGGVTPILTGDNLKSAVTRADRYDPDLNPDFAAFCMHYGTAAVPARPRKPKDKNLIEGALGIFWRWIRGRIRAKRFYSLQELNAFVWGMLEKFNHRIQRKYGMSRRQKFEAGERALLKSLPAAPYEICEWKSAKIHWDCFAQVGKNFYSAPYALRGKEVGVRLTNRHVEFYLNLERVALHRRLPANQQGRYSRQDDHLPPAHKAMLEMVPQKCLQEAATIGPETSQLVQHLITRASHPLTYLRRTLGILRLKMRYSAEALERACRTVNSLPEVFPRLKTIEGVLKAQTSQAANVAEVPTIIRRPNPNLRGQNHWMQPVDEPHSA